MWIAIVVSALAAGPDGACGCQDTSVSGDTRRAESPSFVVVSHASQHDARTTARACECWRRSLHAHWCSGSDEAVWSPKCEIVIHPGCQSYLVAVGAGGTQTFASSWIEFARDKKVSKRRIDLRGDGQLGIAALPHEMTHVVLADLLGGVQPPRWADEGMALLADSTNKQTLHERDLREGLDRGLAFSAAELVAIDTYPHPSRIPAFYGQSASLTAFLVTRDKPSKFIEFLCATQEHGYDQALRETYDIQSLRELERLWLAHRQQVQSNSREVLLALDEAQPLKRRTPPTESSSVAQSSNGGGAE